MSGRAAASPRARGPHAERTAQTRARVIEAVVESIAEHGIQKTTASEIARRAGVTWGAVQHHFGDKDGILVAVVEASFDRFAQQVGDPPPEGTPLDRRVGRFVERAWAHFSSPHYRSTLEILLNLPADLEPTWQAGMLDAWLRLWAQHFPESQPARRKTVELMHYAISVMSGLATTRMLEGRADDARAGELRFLRETMVRELSG